LELEDTNKPDKQSTITYNINNIAPYLRDYSFKPIRLKHYKMIFHENHHWIGRDMKNTFFSGYFFTFGTKEQQWNTITRGTRVFLERFNLGEILISSDKNMAKSLLGTSSIKITPTSNDAEYLYKNQDLAVWIFIK
jgi:hypothetical protein